ncbi:MAG TPA: 2-oxoglutarate dehydrogenase E1 component [Longimicrobium sp.]|nr:2-oxoglutarate dehydrogenase E1 component [Longimicrobium sp.]
MADLREFTGPNAAYVLDLYDRFLSDPASVEEGWRGYFAAFAPPTADAPRAASGADVERVIAGRELARAIRARGHTAARLDPLGSTPTPDPVLEPAAHGITEADLAALPAAVVRNPPPGAGDALAAVRALREIYSGPVGYEFVHLADAGERAWMREAIESGRFSGPLGAERSRALLGRLSEVQGFENFLHRAFFGQKRFSIEGNDAMIPMLDEIIREAAGSGARDVVIGMAHRGRLNVLTHVLGKPAEMMIEGFLGANTVPGDDAARNSDEPSGDVKYHMGWQTEREIEGARVRVTLSPNPSHLEFVNPVVVGMARSAQDDTTGTGAPRLETAAAVAVLIHGDAAFPGQGVVPETFNMAALPGYTVGGTLHIIANNQVGFTTGPEMSRSTLYSSDLAKGFDLPIVHVNADDAEACINVTRLAQAYRRRFGKDFVIDLVGYRRWGHNEGDEPSFTQPVMYEGIKDHPTVRDLLARRLVAEGAVARADADAMLQSVLDELGRKTDALKAGEHAPRGHDEKPSRNGKHGSGTAVPADRLRALNEAMLARPDGFTVNARLEKTLQKRRDTLGAEGGIDWGQAEALAFASIIVDGTPVRITGQDAERGTFSHRHAVLNDAVNGARINVLHQIADARATFEIHNSPLSEMAVMGFEYGYTMADPTALVLWEAQFGDFVNGAQVMIDQYLASSFQKWGKTSGLVLLLPHGYEGQGPEHSSARLERFLQLCAENNFRVANCTTSAQYFHLLRRQAASLATDARVLVVMSPKSLLRHPLAASRLEQLSEGAFQPVLPDPTVAGRAGEITRLVLCSGKVYADMVGTGAEQRAERVAIAGLERVAITRVEELYPFPAEELAKHVATLPSLREIVWTQEEPRNMGAWTFVEPRLRSIIPDGVTLSYAGRPERASPAEGYAHRHTAEQNRIVNAALGGAPEAAMRASFIGKRK